MFTILLLLNPSTLYYYSISTFQGDFLKVEMRNIYHTERATENSLQ